MLFPWQQWLYESASKRHTYIAYLVYFGLSKLMAVYSLYPELLCDPDIHTKSPVIGSHLCVNESALHTVLMLNLMTIYRYGSKM
jgi:hypothetical protein